MNILSGPMSAKADALRGVFNPGERLVLFRQASASSTGYEPIDFGGSVIVRSGWQKEVRRFDRGTVARQAVKVFLSTRATPALLSQVAAYAVLTRGATSAAIHKCEPDGGVPQTADEIAWRWLGSQRIGTYTVPSALLLESGGALLLESGGRLLLESN